MTVVALMVLMAAMVSPALQGIGTASSLAQSSSDIASTLEQARAFAMGNNTYVYVGFQEVAAPSSTSGNIGKVEVAIVASRDGTRPYQNSPSALLGSQVVQVARLASFNNLHMASSSSLTSGGMTTRPPSSTTGFVDLSQSTSSVTFQWPLTGAAHYTFNQVIEIDPQGIARMQTGSTYSSTIPSFIEIGLLPTHGGLVNTSSANQAAVQVDGMNGAVSIYRP